MTHALSDSLNALIDQSIVVDVASRYVYIGRLIRVHADFLVLDEADVHDLRDTTTTREQYVLNAREHGHAPNRARVWVSRSELVSLSRLDDVLVAH